MKVKLEKISEEDKKQKNRLCKEEKQKALAKKLQEDKAFQHETDGTSNGRRKQARKT